MLFLYALATAIAAASPATGPGDDRAIVVEGTRNPTRAASDYLDKVLPATMDTEIGRFEDPLCPKVVGLPENLKNEVLGRIAQVAEVSSLRVNPEVCTPNLLIIVVDDKKALIEGMRHKKEAYLYGLGLDRIHQLEHDPSPAAAWQLVDVVGADGMPLRQDGDGFPRLFTTVPASRTQMTTRKRLLAGVVILEQRGLVGVTTRQLADYALVRLLTTIQTRERPAPASSILNLFNEGVQPAMAPPSLTWWDLAFLKALADTRSDALADVQWREIRNKIVAEMAKVRENQ